MGLSTTRGAIGAVKSESPTAKGRPILRIFPSEPSRPGVSSNHPQGIRQPHVLEVFGHIHVEFHVGEEGVHHFMEVGAQVFFEGVFQIVGGSSRLS